MVEATPEIVNRTLSFHKEPPSFSEPHKYYKDFVRIKPKGMGSIAKIITRAVWSDCVWKEGRRREENFEFSDYCVLDIDGGYSIDRAKDELCDTAHVIGTTKSHTDSEHRFRIIMPWSSRILSCEIYRYNVEMRIRNFDADPSGVDGARFFWPCKEIYSVVEVEESFFTEEVKPLPENYRSVHEKQQENLRWHVSMAENGVLAPWIKVALKLGCKDGERNTTIYSLAKHLTYYGWSFEKILDAVLKSPVPLPSAPKKEIEYAIRSGMKKAGRVLRGGKV